MPKRPPKKPTQSFGTINFSKDGKVKPNIRKLPEVKEEQERGAMEIVAEKLQKIGYSLTDIKQLSEPDQDFEAICNGNPIIIQLTELVSRDFHDSITFMLDTETEAAALATSIETKLDRHYSKPTGAEFWLVVYSTFAYLTEYIQGGEKRRSQGLVNARYLLSRRDDNPFDVIWFSNLVTRPVKVFPVGE